MSILDPYQINPYKQIPGQDNPYLQAFSQIPNLITWFNPFNMPQGADGRTITNWEDKFGNIASGIQTPLATFNETAAGVPVLQNFANSGIRLGSNSFPILADQSGFTIVMAVNLKEITSNQILFYMLGSNAIVEFGISSNYAGSVWYETASNNNAQYEGSAYHTYALPNKWQIWQFRVNFAANSADLWIDSVKALSGVATNNSSTANTYNGPANTITFMSDGAPSNTVQGFLSDALIFNRALSDLELETVRQFIEAQYPIKNLVILHGDSILEGSPNSAFADKSNATSTAGTGTIATTAWSNLVTGTGTSFKSYNQGDIISCAGASPTHQIIKTILNDTQLYTVDPYMTSVSGQSFNQLNGFDSLDRYSEESRLHRQVHNNMKHADNSLVLNYATGGRGFTNSFPSWNETAGAGTVAITNGFNVVTGTGTAFTSLFSIGDVINIPGATQSSQEITEVTSDTSLIVASTYTQNLTGQSYSKVPTLITELFSTILPIITPPMAQKTIVVGTGLNDYTLTSASAATIYSKLKQYAYGAQNSGCQVVAFTPIGANTSAADTVMGSLQSDINGTAGVFDAIADVRNASAYANNAATSNAAYYIQNDPAASGGSGVHPTPFGVKSVIAPIVATAVDSICKN